MTKTESAPTGLTIFHVTDSGNGGYIQTRTISHILENHRTNISFISILEEFQLKINDGLHRQIKCMATLFDSLNIITCTIHLFLGIE